MVKLIRWATDDDEEDEKYIPFGLMFLLMCVSLYAIVVSAQRIRDTFLLSIDFVVESSHQVCEAPLNNRCVTHYTVKNGDGTEHDFVPFGDPFSDDLLVFDPHIVKTARSFTYEIGGREERWPYLWQHIFALFAGVVGLIFLFKLISTRKLFFGFRRPFD